MNVARYPGSAGDGTGLDASTHGPHVISEIEQAQIGFIDDPMSFPWELLADSNETPLVVDVGRCSPDQLIALGPALSSLTEFDTIIDSTGGLNHEPLAESLGARQVEPATDEWAALWESKRLQRIESGIIERLKLDWNATTVDFADVASVHWPEPQQSSNGEPQPEAILVRLSGDTIRSARRGFASLAGETISAVRGSHILDVWGIRLGPGEPLVRAVLAIGRDR